MCKHKMFRFEGLMFPVKLQDIEIKHLMYLGDERSAVLENGDKGKENSCHLFVSTLRSKRKNEKEMSVSSPDTPDTDSDHSLPVPNASDESCIDDDKITDQPCTFGDVPRVSQECQDPLKNYSLLDSNVKTSLSSNSSALSHISNHSSYGIPAADDTFSKPESVLTHKTNDAILEDKAAVDNNNDALEDNLTNEDIIMAKQQIEGKRVRSKDYCYFCEGLVLNFVRHITRHHFYEPEVQKILSTSKKSHERKQLITKLRKKGNFIQNSVEVTRPMRKLKFASYLPCTNCLGFYSRKHLWKHKKKCTKRSDKTTTNVQSEAQNLLLRHLKIDEKLKNIVFLRMRADETSLVAKSDVLICAFGSQYLKTYRKRHLVNVVSRKMRELAKLLQVIKKIDPSIKDLFDALKSTNYDTIVAATKVVGKYDTNKDTYESSAFVINISTSIKQCCKIAILFALKKQGPYMNINIAEVEADLKKLIQMMDANWKFDVSSRAASNLNTNKWNKVTLVSLTNDLKVLKEYLGEKSAEAANTFKEGSLNVLTYLQLLETIYCRILLQNRLVSGELQIMKVNEYLESDIASDQHEEFDRALTISERILVHSFKRVVIITKCGRGVPILLSKEVQEDIELLLSKRNIFVPKSNHFLFGNPGHDNAIIGYKVIDKYAKQSGTKNSKAISSTRFRKHIATLSQIFSMSENYMEQLATFIRHKSGIQTKSNWLPDDIYQTSKIYKLLILMEDGRTDAFRGKFLDDIEMDLNEELDEGTTENDEILNYDLESLRRAQDTTDKNTSPIPPQPGPSGLQTITLKTGLNVKTGKTRTLTPWTAEQKKVCATFFKNHIINKQPPKKQECEILKERHPNLLNNKDWLKIKVFIQNIYTKKTI